MVFICVQKPIAETFLFFFLDIKFIIIIFFL